MQKTPIHPEVQALLRELFDADMTRKWGWGETLGRRRHRGQHKRGTRLQISRPAR